MTQNILLDGVIEDTESSTVTLTSPSTVHITGVGEGQLTVFVSANLTTPEWKIAVSPADKKGHYNLNFNGSYKVKASIVAASDTDATVVLETP